MMLQHLNKSVSFFVAVVATLNADDDDDDLNGSWATMETCCCWLSTRSTGDERDVAFMGSVLRVIS